MSRGAVLVLAAATLWGLSGAFAKILLARGIGPLEIAFWRAGFGWVLFAGHALARGRLRVSGRDLPAVLLFGLLCISVFYGAYQVAIREAGMAVAVMLLYTAPAWVASFAWVVLGEPMRRGTVAGVILTLVGVGLLSLGPSLGAGELRVGAFGLAAGLVSGLTYALYYIFGKRYLPQYATETLFLYALPVGAVGLVAFVDFAPKSTVEWLLLVVFAAVSSYLAFSIYYAGLRRLDATRASVIATFEPVVGVAAGMILFGERLGAWGLAGGATIVGAVVLVVLTTDGPSRVIEGRAGVALKQGTGRLRDGGI
jgi:drug/metabolite transporter (DMT)-like permease